MLKNTKGSSLVSTIVAFAILMIGLAGFTTSIFAALSATRQAADIRHITEDASEEYYLNKKAGKEVPVDTGNGIFYFKDEEGHGFALDNQEVEEYTYEEDGEKFKIYYFK